MTSTSRVSDKQDATLKEISKTWLQEIAKKCYPDLLKAIISRENYKSYSAEQLALQMKEVEDHFKEIYDKNDHVTIKEHAKSSIEDTVNQLAEEVCNMKLLMAK
jgi:hypothetical protein